MSREYARRSKGGGGNLPLIIAIVGTVIVIAVILYFLLGNSGGGGGIFNKATPTPTLQPTYTPPVDTPTPGPTPSPTPGPTMQVIVVDESPSAEVIQQATPTPVPKAYKSATIAKSALNVREGPGMDYGVIGKVRYGETYKVWDETSKWIKIQLSSGSYGWVWESYTAREGETLPPRETSPPADSLVESASVDSGSTKVTIKFKDEAYGSSTPTNYVKLSKDAFSVKEGTTERVTAVSDCAGGKEIILTLSGATAGAELKLTVDGSKIYDKDGEDTGDYSKTFNSGADVTAPTITSSSISAKVISIGFSEEVYSGSGGDIGNSAFEVFTATIPKGTLTYTVSHTAGNKSLTITLTNVSGAETVYVNIASSGIKDSSGNYAGGGKQFDYDGT